MNNLNINPEKVKALKESASLSEIFNYLLKKFEKVEGFNDLDVDTKMDLIDTAYISYFVDVPGKSVATMAMALLDVNESYKKMDRKNQMIVRESIKSCCFLLELNDNKESKEPYKALPKEIIEKMEFMKEWPGFRPILSLLLTEEQEKEWFPESNS